MAFFTSSQIEQLKEKAGVMPYFDVQIQENYDPLSHQLQNIWITLQDSKVLSTIASYLFKNLGISQTGELEPKTTFFYNQQSNIYYLELQGGLEGTTEVKILHEHLEWLVAELDLDLYLNEQKITKLTFCETSSRREITVIYDDREEKYDVPKELICTDSRPNSSLNEIFRTTPLKHFITFVHNQQRLGREGVIEYFPRQRGVLTDAERRAHSARWYPGPPPLPPELLASVTQQPQPNPTMPPLEPPPLPPGLFAPIAQQAQSNSAPPSNGPLPQLPPLGGP